MRMVRRPAIERFWSHVDKNGPIPAHQPELGPCWVWTAAHLKAGYGHFKVESYHQVLAHRFSYELVNGVIPARLLVLHRCDNPPCVRPDHLIVGTARDNGHDMSVKGRSYAITKPERIQRGERHPRSRLTWEQVLDIRARWQPDQGLGPILGREFGVTKETIYHVVAWKVWKKQR